MHEVFYVEISRVSLFFVLSLVADLHLYGDPFESSPSCKKRSRTRVSREMVGE